MTALETPMARPSDAESLSEVAGVILAGGLSRRMGGGDKSLLEVGGRSMLAAVMDRLADQAAPLVLNANGDPRRFEHFGLPVFADPIDGYVGPLAGILGGMRWARQNSAARWIVTVPADTPFIPRNLVDHLLTSLGVGDAEIAIARSGGRSHPVVGLWQLEMADDLEHWLGDADHRRADAWVASRRFVEVTFDSDQEFDPFFNVNTPQDAMTAAGLAVKVS